MDKRHLHHVWTKLRRLKPWYFLALAVITTAVCVFALRANNQHMVQLRDTVYQADKDNGDVSGALRNLQAYVTSHMNTDLSSGPNGVYPPIQLKYTYERLVQAQKDAQTSNQLYTKAQHYCEGRNSVDFSGRNRVPCIEQYVQSHGGAKPYHHTGRALQVRFRFTPLVSRPGWLESAGRLSVLATIRR